MPRHAVRFPNWPSLVAVVLLAACAPAASPPPAYGPQVWIDAPLSGDHLPLAPYGVLSHANHPAGVASFELSINGLVVQTDLVPADQAGQPLAYIYQAWVPPAPGDYLISIRAAGADGTFGDPAAVRVRVGETTATPSAEALDPTPTSTAEPVALGDPQFSSAKFYFEGDGCGARRITVQTTAADPRIVSVVLFFRLADIDGPGRTGWMSVAMNPQGAGVFTRTLSPEADIPGFATYLESFFQVQLVASDGLGNEVARSPLISQVRLLPCA